MKSKSASPTLRKHSKEPSEEKRIQSSTSERESGKLGVQEIVSISCSDYTKKERKRKIKVLQRLVLWQAVDIFYSVIV